jgi:hypothetical protein
MPAPDDDPRLSFIGSFTHGCRSAAGHLLQLFEVASPLHRDLGGGALDLPEIVGCQVDASRSDVLLKPEQLRGAGDRHDPRLLGQQPGNRDLSRRRLLPLRDPFKQIVRVVRKSVLSNVVFSSILPVRKPLPNGL